VFHTDGDYRAFLDLLAAAKAKHPLQIFGFCLMPNHFHLVLQLARDASPAHPYPGLTSLCPTTNSPCFAPASIANNRSARLLGKLASPPCSAWYPRFARVAARENLSLQSSLSHFFIFQTSQRCRNESVSSEEAPRWNCRGSESEGKQRQVTET
jgi:hypothetical protein